MARIPGDEIERLKRDVSLERLVKAAGIELRRHGADLPGLCPFHDDREPSLVITPDKNLWHCLGACQTGGSVIDWVMRTKGVSFRHAVELLKADHPALAAPVERIVRKDTASKLDAPISADAADREVLGQVVDYYHDTLKQSPEALRYLESRGLTHPEMAGRFKLGFANRTAGVSGIPALGWMPTASSQINAANNQLTVSGLNYDTGGGNQTTFRGTSTTSPIQYDAENRQVQVVTATSTTYAYTYDGMGQRVSRTVGGATTEYVHDVFGNLAAEYNPPGSAACTTCYLSWDHPGSTRMVTDGSGNLIARHDYLPFGVEIPNGVAGRSGVWGVTDGLSPKFTGQDHDAETWNMYGYVRNSPLTLIDPSGLDQCDAWDASCDDGGDPGVPWPGWGGGSPGLGQMPPNVPIPYPGVQQGPGGGNGFGAGSATSPGTSPPPLPLSIQQLIVQIARQWAGVPYLQVWGPVHHAGRRL